MSTGLGPQQRLALSILAEHPRGILSAELAVLMGVERRRGTAIVVSLRRRKLVLVTVEGRAHRVWLPDAYANRLNVLDAIKPPEVCPTCGQSVPKRTYGGLKTGLWPIVRDGVVVNHGR